MKRHELEHIIRAATDATEEFEIVVIGSQSILGTHPNPPPELVMSMEADVYPPGAEHKVDVIDGVLGEGSPFHETHGFYAQGVDSKTATLPRNWQSRLCRVQNANTADRIGFCISPVDLFLSKCAAGRPKDIAFNTALLFYGYVKVAEAISLVSELDVSKTQMDAILARIRRLDAAAQESIKQGGLQKESRKK